MTQSRTAYERQLTAFLLHEKQRVLLFQGRWGIGKTHLWKEFLEHNRNSIAEKYYSYVSLFGTTSLSQIKSLALFASKSVKQVKPMDFGQQIARLLAKKHKYLKDLKIPYLGNVGSLLPVAEEFLIRDYLLCFDDLERRSQTFDLQQFFGFVAVLKEQNNCRVAIICNENELSDSDRKAFDQYREKIVDRAITYEPSFDDNFHIVFPQGDEIAESVFRQVHLNNIRVFQHTAWCLEYFAPHLTNRHPPFVNQFREQCIKLCCVHYAFARQLSLDEVRKTSWLFAELEAGSKAQADKNRLIQELEFSPTDADEFIVDYLRNGYCDIGKLTETIDRMDQNYRRSEGEAKLRDVWALYYNSFRADSTEIKKAAVDWFETYYSLAAFESIKALLDFIQRIDSSFDAAPLVERAALAAIPEASADLLKAVESLNISANVGAAIDKRRVAITRMRPIDDLIATLADPDGWTPADFAALDMYDEDALFQWFSKADGHRLLGATARVMVRAQLRSADSRPTVATKLRNVIRRLAARSVLDRARAEMLFEGEKKLLVEHGVEPRTDGTSVTALSPPVRRAKDKS